MTSACGSKSFNVNRQPTQLVPAGMQLLQGSRFILYQLGSLNGCDSHNIKKTML